MDTAAKVAGGGIKIIAPSLEAANCMDAQVQHPDFAILDFALKRHQRNRYMKVENTINGENFKNGYRYQHTS